MKGFKIGHIIPGINNAFRKPVPLNQKETVAEPKKEIPKYFPKEIVAGGDIRWRPANKQAAMLLAKAPWWAFAPVEKQKTQEPVKPKKKMRTSIAETSCQVPAGKVEGDSFVSRAGIRITMVNGEPLFNLDDVRRVILDEVNHAPSSLAASVKSAKDAREVLNELFHGIGGDIEGFKTQTGRYLTDIRQTRFAVVTETAAITAALKEIRGFFLQSDYEKEIARLNEFVGLCERLQKLKESGFLDKIADTMLTLAVDPSSRS